MPVAQLVSAGPSVATGIGTGPPGEAALPAVKTSTPVSVTSKVCSVRILAMSHEREAIPVRTKLSSPLAINGHISPFIRPVNLTRFP